MQLLRLLHCIIILRSSTKHFILFMDHILAKCYLVGTHGYGNPGSSLLCTERLQVLFLDTEIVHTIKSLTMTKLQTHFEFDCMSFWYKLRLPRQRRAISATHNKCLRVVPQAPERGIWFCKPKYLCLFECHTTLARTDLCQDSEGISKSPYLQQRQGQTCIRC